MALCLAPRHKDTYQVGRPIPNLQPLGAMLLQYNIVCFDEIHLVDQS